MIIIPGQGGTYRHLRDRVTHLLADSGLTTGICDPAGGDRSADPVPVVVWRAAAIACDRWIVWRKGGEMVVVELAVMAANALVQAVVTDGWEGVRHRLARMFGRGEPDPAIERRLDETRGLLVGTPTAEFERVQADLAGQWRIRFADLLADHPDAEAELADFVEELKAVTVTAVGHSVAAGRDVNVSADQGSVAAAVIHGDVKLPGPRTPGPASS
jgi:hypothetical protein